MKTITIELPDTLVDDLEQKTASLGYGSVSEYVSRAVLAHHNETLEQLEQLIEEGLNSGEPIDATPAFWSDLRSECEERIVNRDAVRKASAA